MNCDVAFKHIALQGVTIPVVWHSRWQRGREGFAQHRDEFLVQVDSRLAGHEMVLQCIGSAEQTWLLGYKGLAYHL